jgi:hypothetical protein
MLAQGMPLNRVRQSHLLRRNSCLAIKARSSKNLIKTGFLLDLAKQERKIIMSVTLYSKASYTALSHNLLFQALCRHYSWDYKEFAAELFELNAASYQNRYQLSPNNGDIQAERMIERIDSEFATAFEENRKTSLYRLLKKIDYQSCEYESDSVQWSTVYNRLQWLKERLADQICDEYDQMMRHRKAA